MYCKEKFYLGHSWRLKGLGSLREGNTRIAIDIFNHRCSLFVWVFVCFPRLSCQRSR